MKEKKKWINWNKYSKHYDKVLRSFNIKRNIRKLFSESKYDVKDKEFEVLNAIKVFSICIIVLGNTYFYTLSGPVQNLEIVHKLF